ncbi:hypothetical protein GU243_10805 [Pseudarthrobacter psychrotolerans]|uniref:Uncharacterized protein n=1 Tax=Pseudarthrobacter psychrotolerans TaxID=2697569 RepID=A0A6P1NM79_9MICC|nr:hypothetical protein [Pseudarthrobacter psychrotolerans]QHK20143.1 hypothetical protein GU243_10805 [Pseudarthrobacter psychrotolerans]
MDVTKFRIPNTDIYLRSDGLFAPTADPGDKVLDLTSDNAETVKAAYLGQALRQMAVRSGLSNDAKNESEFTAEAAKDVLDWVSFGFDTYVLTPTENRANSAN